jgi:hypothetical protein
MVPVVFTPQANRVPALTDVKVSAGGDDSPCPSKPQQATVPSVLALLIQIRTEPTRREGLARNE